MPLLDSREVMSVVLSSSRPPLLFLPSLPPSAPLARSPARPLTAPPAPSNANKVRIIALYIQYREGVPDEDRRRLYQHARLSLPEQDAVNALVHLGVRISRVRAPTPPLHSSSRVSMCARAHARTRAGPRR